MENANDDVENGIANGTTYTLKQAILLPGKKPHAIQMHGYWVWVYAVSATYIAYMQLNFQDSSRFVGKFRVRAKTLTYSVNFPCTAVGKTGRVSSKMNLTQFPVVVNHATTVHKLQGKTMDRLVIAEWCAEKNWAYVAISRVRTLAGL